MPADVDGFLRLLDLEEIELGLYRGHQPVTQMQRAFGGQVLGQSVMAAANTVENNRQLHSLHAYFLLPGRTDIPMIYDTENTRDGRSFSTRRVLARQGGRVIFTASLSFHVPEEGLDHARPAPNDVPAPDDCPTLAEAMGRDAQQDAGWQREFGALEVRVAQVPDALGADGRPSAAQRFWVRIPGVPQSPFVHEAALAYVSDLTLLTVATVPHGLRAGHKSLSMASIDHTMWFHRPFDISRWMLYDQHSPSASRGVGLAMGSLYQDGQLVVSVAQEGLLRLLKHKS